MTWRDGKNGIMMVVRVENKGSTGSESEMVGEEERLKLGWKRVGLDGDKTINM